MLKLQLIRAMGQRKVTGSDAEIPDRQARVMHDCYDKEALVKLAENWLSGTYHRSSPPSDKWLGNIYAWG